MALEPGQGQEGAALPGGRGRGRAPGAPDSTRRQGELGKGGQVGPVGPVGPGQSATQIDTL